MKRIQTQLIKNRDLYIEGIQIEKDIRLHLRNKDILRLPVSKNRRNKWYELIKISTDDVIQSIIDCSKEYGTDHYLEELYPFMEISLRENIQTLLEEIESLAKDYNRETDDTYHMLELTMKTRGLEIPK